MNLIKKLGLGLAGVAVFIGIRFWNKSDNHDAIKEQLISTCAEDKSCTNAVEKHFDSCFESNYSLGGRRKSGSLNRDKFLSCFNQKAGQQFFVIKGE